MNMLKQQRKLNILFAFDGSQHALAAVDMICDLQIAGSSLVRIIGVLIPRESSNHAILSSALDHAGKLLSDQGIDTEIELILGYPAEQIILAAHKYSPDLIVIGAKGLRQTLGILLGGVAQQIVEYANQPVLIVRAPYLGIKKILFVTDGSSSSQRALEYMAGISESGGEFQCQPFPFPKNSIFQIMHVLPPVPSADLITRSWPVGTEVLPPISPQIDLDSSWLQDEENHGKTILENTLSYFSKCTEIQAATYLKRGDAATEILEHVREEQIDLILAGSRGLSEVQSWLLGSVSRKLVHYAPCSVLVIKGQNV